MSNQQPTSPSGAILVIGGGIAGMTVAVEAAETGREVWLVEKTPTLGGRVARMFKYFPKLCPPACGLEINYQRLRKNHGRVHVLTLAQVEKIDGKPGAFEATLRMDPRFVNEKCTICGECAKVCPVERPNDFNANLDKTRAIYLPHEMAYPPRYVIDAAVCPGASCGKCLAACKYAAIELNMAPKRMKIAVGAVVVATGWAPFDAKALDNLSFGVAKNVITNAVMERLASPNGPTKGRIVRPSDGQPPRRVVFVQCAGSRDVNHLPYCSGVCCLVSLKQAAYVREQIPESKAQVFYIDLRASGVYEDFLTRIQADENVTVKKGKVAKITENAATGELDIEVEDVLGAGKMRVKADLAVLATGMVPSIKAAPLPFEMTCDEYGFCAGNGHQAPGLIAAGTAKAPTDVATAIQDATGAALKAIQILRNGLRP